MWLIGFFATLLAIRVVRQTRARGDQPADHHVFLQAAQIVPLAGYRRFGQHPCRFLERSRRDERFRGQRGLRDAEQQPLVTNADLAVGIQSLVLLEHRGVLRLLATNELRVTRIDDFDLAQHLPDDDFDVFVVDRHALEPVNLLDLIRDVPGQFRDALQPQDVMRRQRTIRHHFAPLDKFPFEHRNVAPLGNERFVGVGIQRRDHEPALAFRFLAEAHRAGCLRQNGRLLRLARLEQIGHAWQTARDVLRLAALLGYAGDDIADADRRAVFQVVQHGVRRQQIGSRQFRIGQHQCFALVRDQPHGRLEILAGGRPILRIQHHDVRQARDLVGLTVHRQVFLHIVEDDLAGHLGDDRMRVGIPLRHNLPRDHDRAFRNRQHRTVGQLVPLALATVLVGHRDIPGARYRHQFTRCLRDEFQVVQAHAAAMLNLHTVDRSRPTGRATDVERAHRQLRARLANGLRRDDAHRLADVNHMTAGEIAPVAHRAHAMTRIARDRRPHPDLVHAQIFQTFDPGFVQHRAGFDEQRLAVASVHVVRDHPAEHPRAEHLDDVAALDQRRHDQPVARTAIDVGHHKILRNIDQPAREVTRVRGLQRRVGQALARTVGGDEVLVDRQSFAEVRDDRCLDDRTIRPRHRPAHPRQLANLGRRSTRTGVGVHEHGVERRLLDLVTGLVNHPLAGDAFHHRFTNEIVGARPDVDDLVVLLALGDQTGRVLRLDFLHLDIGFFDDDLFLFRDFEVVHADRGTRAGGVFETQIHQLITEDHRFLQTNVAIALVEQSGDRLLGHRTIDVVERQRLGHDFIDQRAADRGIHERAGWIHVTLGDPHLDPCLQCHLATAIGAVHFVDVRERHAFALGVHAFPRHVVQAEHDVLRRHDDRLAGGRRQDVVGRHHQRAGFQLRFERQRHVDGHLVTVEVRVVRRAHERVQLNRLAFDQHGLERLNAETVQGRCAVQEHGMLADHLGEDVPHLGGFPLHHLLGSLDRGRHAARLELAEDEWLEQFQRHLLRQTALMQAQRGTDHNHGATGIIDALAEEVLPETALLALDHVRQRLQRPLVGAGDGPTTSAIVEQRIDCLLQHALFVAHDDVRRRQVQQPLQTVVAVDDAAVQVVQIGSRETAAVQRHQRPEVRWQHRQHGKHHPLRLVA